jgi:hypothetical protein
VRLSPGGPLYRVTRVNTCAAYLKSAYETPREVVLPNGRSFMANEGGSILAVSPNAFTYPE